MYVNNLLRRVPPRGRPNWKARGWPTRSVCRHQPSLALGKFVVPEAFGAQPEEFTQLIEAQDAEGLIIALTYKAVEDRAVVPRVTNARRACEAGYQRGPARGEFPGGVQSVPEESAQGHAQVNREVSPEVDHAGTKDVQVGSEGSPRLDQSTKWDQRKQTSICE